MAKKSNQTTRTIIPTFEKADIEENKLVASFSYVWILVLIPLFFKRSSKYCQFHARQGVVLFFMELVGSLFIWFPILGQIMCLGFVIFSIMGFLMALSGKAYHLPWISDVAKKIHLSE